MLDLELPGNIQGGSGNIQGESETIHGGSENILGESFHFFLMFRRAASTGFNKDFVKISKEYLI